MTEERFNELKKLRDKIDITERKLYTIEKLIESVNLGMEITGRSTCHFKIKRFIKLGGDDWIKSILDGERKNTEYELSKLREDFDKQ